MIHTDGSGWTAGVFDGDGGLEQPWREGPVAALLAEALGGTRFVVGYPANQVAFDDRFDGTGAPPAVVAAAGRPVADAARARAGG